MEITVQFGTDLATVQDHVWSSSNRLLRSILNSLVPADGPSGSDPWPDLTLAREMADLLGGRVVDVPVRRSHLREDVVY